LLKNKYTSAPQPANPVRSNKNKATGGPFFLRFALVAFFVRLATPTPTPRSTANSSAGVGGVEVGVALDWVAAGDSGGVGCPEGAGVGEALD
jgi:hypothetical protein